jgi:hypothetical protein
MPASISTLVLKDGNGLSKTVQVLDLSGTGSGPFVPAHMLVNANGEPYDATRPLAISDAGGSLTVDGVISVSNFPATQAVSGAVTVSNFPSSQTVAGSVSVSNLPATQAVSASALPLPTGAATAAKQPALGVAGTSSNDVISVQGITNGTALTVDSVFKTTSTDRGSTITAGGTAQQLMAANSARRGFVIQNQSLDDLYVNSLGVAAANQTSLRIAPGQLYETPVHHVGTGAISIFGATTGQAFYGREF